MEEEYFINNHNIKKQIMTKYLQVKSNMEKLNNAYRYNEIELKPRESRIMLEILKFYPQFEKKWTKGCKFVYANSKNDQGVMYNDIFIKSLEGELRNFSKKKCEENLGKIGQEFKKVIRNETKEKEKFEEQVATRKGLGICTVCFGYDTANKKFVFCDCLLVRTNYTEFTCSNPLEQHNMIEGMYKSLYRYEDGYEGEDPNDIQSEFSKYYQTKDTIQIPGKENIKKGDILYQLNPTEYILVGKENDIEDFRINIKKYIDYANNNNQIIKLNRNDTVKLSKYVEK